MWLLTTQGSYSVVAHRDDPDKLLVRSRTRTDIEALRKQIPTLEPFEDSDADYHHRAVVSRGEWLVALAQLVTELDYDNFKSAVAEHQGSARAALYEAVWGRLRRLQRSGDDDVE